MSKDGSTFKISVSTSDISVLEKSPPRHINTETEKCKKLNKINSNGRTLKVYPKAKVIMTYQ